MEGFQSLLRIKSQIPDVHSDAIFTVLGFPIHNTTLALVAIAIFVAVIAYIFSSVAKEKPGKFQNVVEMVYEMLVSLITSVAGSNKVAMKLLPFVGTIFIFVFLSNFYGLIPGINEITFAGKPLLRQPTTDFNTTLSLTLLMLGLIQLASIRDFGILGYLGRFIKVKELYHGLRTGISATIMALIEVAIGLLDIVSEVAKAVSLSLRLFGNMYAGQVLATVILAGFAYGIPAIWMAMSTLSAVVQTLVFSLLVTAYYTTSVGPEPEAKNI